MLKLFKVIIQSLLYHEELHLMKEKKKKYEIVVKTLYIITFVKVVNQLYGFPVLQKHCTNICKKHLCSFTLIDPKHLASYEKKYSIQIHIFTYFLS